MRLRSWEIIILLVASVCLIVFFAARTLGASTTNREGIVTRTARPAIAFWREPVDVEVRVNSSGLPTCATAADVSPIYAALVIDRSGSMDGPPLEEARNAASDFVDLMNLIKEGDQVAVVSFDDTATLDRQFNFDRAQSIRAIQQIPDGGGGTNIASGLLLATQQFALNPPPTNARQVIILLSDGQSDASAAMTAADQAKSQGIRVVTVALGGADQSVLAALASSSGDFYATSDPASLLNIYGNIAEGLVGSAATDLEILEYYNAGQFNLISSLYRAQQTGNQITWQAPFVGQRGRSLGYLLQPTALGWHQVSPTPGQMSLTDCNGQLVSQATPTGPRVLVLFPVWLLYIFPLLALLWLLYRILRAIRNRPQAQPAGAPGRRDDIPVGPPVKQEATKPSGKDVTHGRPAKPRKRDEETDQ